MRQRPTAGPEREIRSAGKRQPVASRGESRRALGLDATGPVRIRLRNPIKRGGEPSVRARSQRDGEDDPECRDHSVEIDTAPAGGDLTGRPVLQSSARIHLAEARRQLQPLNVEPPAAIGACASQPDARERSVREIPALDRQPERRIDKGAARDDGRLDGAGQRDLLEARKAAGACQVERDVAAGLDDRPIGDEVRPAVGGDPSFRRLDAQLRHLQPRAVERHASRHGPRQRQRSVLRAKLNREGTRAEAARRWVRARRVELQIDGSGGDGPGREPIVEGECELTNVDRAQLERRGL